MYDGMHTSFDVMKEFLIYGAELDGKYQFPIIPACRLDYMPVDSVDFGESFSRKIKNHRELNVNFFIDDFKFTRIFNSPDKYIEHLKCFHSVMQPDFSVSTGRRGMPFAINVYNKYRNHALGFYLHANGITVIPSVGILDKENWSWGFDGYPQKSVVSVCTNGRIKSKDARTEFCDGFREMCRRLNPTQVIIIGKIPQELETDVKIINFKTRNQKINEEFSNGDEQSNKKEETEGIPGTKKAQAGSGKQRPDKGKDRQIK